MGHILLVIIELVGPIEGGNGLTDLSILFGEVKVQVPRRKAWQYRAAAIAGAWFNRHLAAATVAVMLPTLVDAAGLAAFATSVFLYGFLGQAAS